MTASSSTRLFGDFGSYAFATVASSGTTLYHSNPAAVLSTTNQVLDKVGDGSQLFISLAANKTWAYQAVMAGPDPTPNFYDNNIMTHMSATNKAYWPSAPTQTGSSYATFATDVTLYKDPATTTSTTLTTYYTGAPMLTNATLVGLSRASFGVGNGTGTDGLFLGEAGGAAAGEITNLISGTSIIPTVSSTFLENSAIIAQSLSDNIVIGTSNVSSLSSKSYIVS
jgi:hypothetical protein